MLNRENLKEFINKYQTSEKNVVREYVQNLFLSALYKSPGSEKLLFKGGTALRLIYLSPRFSEDIDFTGQGIYRHEEIDNFFLEALSELEEIGIDISYREAKPTTGGYLGVIHYELFGLSEDMKFEVSLRKSKRFKGDLVTVASDLIPPYTLVYVSPKGLVTGKMDALLSRKKPRDYYDMYFMLRQRVLNRFVDKKRLSIVFDSLVSERINFKRELSVLLPVSQHLILKNFKEVLRKEIKKYL